MMFASLSKIANLDTLPCARLPRSLYERAVKTPVVPAEDKFHKTKYEKLDTKNIKAPDSVGGALSFTHTPPHEQKQAVLVTYTDKAGNMHKVFGFGRSVLTNFMLAKAKLEVVMSASGTEKDTVHAPIDIHSSEQFFAWCKSMFVNLNHPSASEESVMEQTQKTLEADNPNDAKKGGNGQKGFDIEAWNKVSEDYMYYGILAICIGSEETFNRYLEIANLGADVVYELNDDEIWAIWTTPQIFMNKIEEALQATPKGQPFDLLKAAHAVASGQNKLGKLQHQFLTAIRGSSYAEFMAAVGHLRFVEVVDDDVFLAALRAPKRKPSKEPEAQVEVKRTCSDSLE